MTSEKAWDDMSKLVKQFIQMPDAEPFRAEVDWKGLGLFDYPEIIKHPMDLGNIKKKLLATRNNNNSSSSTSSSTSPTVTYSSLFDVAADVRLVWSNCMTYNADGSDFYILAQTLSDKFEKAFSKLLQDHSLTPPWSSSSGGGGDGVTGTSLMVGHHPDVSLEDKRTFAKSLYTISKDELGKVLILLDEKCPMALVKNASEDEVELNVDKISQPIMTELTQFIATCHAASASKNHKTKSKSSNGGGGGPGVTSGSKNVTKKSKTN